MATPQPNAAESTAPRTAFRLIELIPNAPAKVTCMTQHENILFVGTADGRVIVYHLDFAAAQTTGGGPQAHKITFKHIHGRKTIDKISAIGELGRLIVLCDGQVTMHDMTTLDLLPSKINVKGAVQFCVNQKASPETGSWDPIAFRLCIAVKSKRLLCLYEYNQGEYTHLKDLAVPDLPVTMAWYGHSLCVGYKREYNLVNDATGVVTEIPITLDTNSALVKLLPGGVILLAGIAQLGVMINLQAQPRNGTIKWSKPPTALAYAFPYLVSLVHRSHIEVHNLIDQRPVQHLPFRGGRILSGGEGFFSGEEGNTSKRLDPYGDSALSGIGGGGSFASESRSSFVMASGRVGDLLTLADGNKCVYLLQPVPVAEQASELIQNQLVPDAFQLLHSCMEEEGVDRAVFQRFHLDAGLVLFLDLQLEDAFRHWQRSTLDPRELIVLFPSLLMTELPHSDSDDDETYGDSVTDAVAAGGSSGGGQRRRHAAVGFVPQFLTRAAFTQALGALGDSAFTITTIISRLQGEPTSGSAAGRRRSTVPPLVSTALSCLVDLLEYRRANPLQPQAAAGSELRRMVDTALLKGYAAMHRADDIHRLLTSRPPPSLSLTDAVATLEDAELYPSLATLYLCYGLHRECLDVWARMGTGELVPAAVHTEDAELGMLSDLSDGKSDDGQNDGHGRARSGREGQRPGVVETIMLLRHGSGSTYLSDEEKGDGGAVAGHGDGDGDLGYAAAAAGEDPRSVCGVLGVETVEEGLVWMYSAWVLRENPGLGLNIFSRSRRQPPLPPDRVLEHLNSFRSHPQCAFLPQRYLEHLVLPAGWTSWLELDPPFDFEDEDTTDAAAAAAAATAAAAAAAGAGGAPSERRGSAVAETASALIGQYRARFGLPSRFHTELALTYIGNILRMRREQAEGADGAAGGMRELRPAVGRRSKRRGGGGGGGDSPAIARVLAKLRKFLLWSHRFNARTLLDATADTQLHGVRVLLYQSTDSHMDALRALVYDLRDIDGAVAYCSRHSPPQEEDPCANKSLYLLLLRVFLYPRTNGLIVTAPPAAAAAAGNADSGGGGDAAAGGGGGGGAVAAAAEDLGVSAEHVRECSEEDVRLFRACAMQLLETQARWLNAVSVVDLLPPSMPLSAALDFLRQAMPASSHAQRQGQLTHSLTHAQHFRTRRLVTSLRRRTFVVDDAARCAMCRKTLDHGRGERTVFAIFPNNRLVHFNCIRNLEHDVDPVTGVRFQLNAGEGLGNGLHLPSEWD